MPYDWQKHEARNRAYSAAYRKRTAPAKAQARRAAQIFVALDSEGGDVGRAVAHGDKSYQPHRSYLWGASDATGNVEWLYSERPLGSKAILSFLLDQAERFPGAIFVSFAFGYDVAQALADLPYETAWAIQHKKYLREKDDPNVRKHDRRWYRWGEFGLQYLKGKSLSVKSYRTGQSIRIYDVFGFFQSSFLHAIKTMPGTVTDAEYAIIERGKSERGNFDHAKLVAMQTYTRMELVALCRMMDRLRDAMEAENINLKTWYGAGSIASALMKRENVKPHLGVRAATQIAPEQAAAHRAFFGGRIELLKQGATDERLYGYDIASAYPAAAALLPSMEGGTWIAPAVASNVAAMSAVSMVQLNATFPPGARFYPLPYRTSKGAIYFGREVRGVYMRDEYLAAVEWVRHFGGTIEIEKIWQFVPANSIRPFEFLRQMFDYRASLPKTDVRGQVVKLGINSVYGKMAQAVGTYQKLPTYANPWYAAAITAWTRAQLVYAAVSDPDAIVMFATDGIISTRALPLETPVKKTLGRWEAELIHGGVWVQSGVYTFCKMDGKWTAKSRGFRPTNMDGTVSALLRGEIRECWKRGQAKYEFPYKNYMTLGASVASPELWELCGHWGSGTREIDLDFEARGGKRFLKGSRADLRQRYSALIDTNPDFFYTAHRDPDGSLPLSYPSKPEWLDGNDAFRILSDDDEQDELQAGF